MKALNWDDHRPESPEESAGFDPAFRDAESPPCPDRLQRRCPLRKGRIRWSLS